MFLLVCWTMGWRVVISEGMLLEKLGKWAEEKAKTNKLFDILVCPWCIPNVQGLLFVYPLAYGMGILNGFHWEYLMMYPFCLGGASFISGMLWNIYLTMNQMKDFFESGVAVHDRQIPYYENKQKYYYNQNKKIKNGSKNNDKKQQ